MNVDFPDAATDALLALLTRIDNNASAARARAQQTARTFKHDVWGRPIFQYNCVIRVPFPCEEEGATVSSRSGARTLSAARPGLRGNNVISRDPASYRQTSGQ